MAKPTTKVSSIAWSQRGDTSMGRRDPLLMKPLPGRNQRTYETTASLCESAGEDRTTEAGANYHNLTFAASQRRTVVSQLTLPSFRQFLLIVVRCKNARLSDEVEK